MSQDTTLPPPCGWPTMLELFIESSATLIRQAQAAECNEHNYEQLLSAVQRVTDYGQQGLSALTKQARAAIAAQAQQPAAVKDSLTPQQAQQAQGVPATIAPSVPENCKNRLFEPTVGCACVFDAGGGWPYQVEDAKKKLTLEAEYKVTKVEVHSSHTRIWIEGHDDWFNNMLFRVLAAAPQAEPQPEREQLTPSQVHDLCNECHLDWHRGWSIDEEPNRYLQLARAIEQAHGIGTKGGE